MAKKEKLIAIRLDKYSLYALEKIQKMEDLDKSKAVRKALTTALAVLENAKK